MAPRGTLKLSRLPLLAIGIATMACGAWLGLVRIGWRLPLPWPDQLNAHGPLMVCGFLGTLISLERAVGLGARWGYAAPVLTAAGALALDLGPSGSAWPGALFITAGSVVMVAIFLVVLRRQPSLFLATMMLGAVAWVGGNAWWLSGASIYRVVFCWMAFLVLTIAGERLELNRVLRPTRVVQLAFVAAISAMLAGVVLAAFLASPGVRLVGAGLIALTVWFARHDVARRTVRLSGVTRFMAVGLLAGYAWLGVAGGIAVVTGVASPGHLYDATLHAVFLGFVMSMVFAHAPVIFPAVLGVPLHYRPIFYAHLAVLHVSVILRLTGDLVDVLGRWRVWGGMMNGIALLLFVVSTVGSIVMTPRRAESTVAAR